jgi:hypothetical protein
MRFKSTIALFVVAAAGLAYFFWFEQPSHRRRTARMESERRVTMASPRSVFALEIERPGLTMKFSRSGSEWRLTEPVRDRADEGLVNTLIHTAVNAEISERFPAESARLSDYGLAQGSVAVRLSDSLQARVLAIAIGDFSLTKTDCYVRKEESDEVLLVPAGLRRYALRGLFAYRDKRVTDFDVDAVTALRIDSKHHRMEWQKSAGAQWLLPQRGDTIRGDRVALDTILREMRALRATEILDDDETNRTRYFRDRRGSLVITSPDARIELVFSARDSDRCYVRVEARGRIDVVAASTLDMFDRSLDDLRDRHLLHFELESLAKMVLDTETSSVSIVKIGDEWSFANPTFGEIDQADVTRFLAVLQDVKYREIVDDRVREAHNTGLDPAARRIALLDAENRVIDEARTGPVDPIRRVRYATSLSSRLLGVVDAESLQALDSLFVRLESR